MFEAFAGMGAQRKALSDIEAKYEIGGMAEWYVPAIISYQAIHNNFSLKDIDYKISRLDMETFLSSLPLSMDSKEPVRDGYWGRKKLDELRIIYTAVKMSKDEGNIFDVRTLYKRKLSDIDLLTYSFPCQDLSQQGKQKGMSRNTGTRSGLLWEIEKALDNTPKSKLPKYLVLENVVALSHKNNRKDLEEWKAKLESLGYKNSIDILNAADFGSSQARRRVFMVSTLGKKIDLPKRNSSPKSIRSIMDSEIDDTHLLPALLKYDLEPFRKTNSNVRKSRLIEYTTFNSEAYVYDPKFTGPTLTASGANSRIKVLDKGHIRKLNAREAYRYMGFKTSDYNRVSKIKYLTETKMIYTCGNSISVQVLKAIFKEIYNG